MSNIRDLLPVAEPRQVKVILLEDKIVVAATHGGTRATQATLAPEHVVLPIQVDDDALFTAVSEMLGKHKPAVAIPRPRYAELYSWLKQPDLVADVDVVEYSETLEVRFSAYPSRDHIGGVPVFARESFSKDDPSFALCSVIRLMLNARRQLLVIEDAPFSRAFDGSPRRAH